MPSSRPIVFLVEGRRREKVALGVPLPFVLLPWRRRERQQVCRLAPVPAFASLLFLPLQLRRRRRRALGAREPPPQHGLLHLKPALLLGEGRGGAGQRARARLEGLNQEGGGQALRRRRRRRGGEACARTGEGMQARGWVNTGRLPRMQTPRPE